MRISSVADLERCFQALSDPTRLRMLALLRRGERCVCEVMAILELSESRASRNLNILKEAGLLEDRRQGQWVYYRLNPSFPAAEALWAFLGQALDEALGSQEQAETAAPPGCYPPETGRSEDASRRAG